LLNFYALILLLTILIIDKHLYQQNDKWGFVVPSWCTAVRDRNKMHMVKGVKNLEF
jgi:hypothetical protein